MLSMTCKRDIFWQPDQCKDKNTRGAGDNVQNEPCGPMHGREDADDGRNNAGKLYSCHVCKAESLECNSYGGTWGKLQHSSGGKASPFVIPPLPFSCNPFIIIFLPAHCSPPPSCLFPLCA